MNYINKRSVVLSCVMLLLLCLVVYGVLGAPRPEPPTSLNAGLIDNNGDRVLRLVHTVARHGARVPADTYPNDPYINETFYPYGWGHLTNNGKSVLYQTGEFLRERYNDFLGDYYRPDILHAQSTGVTRAKMSLEIVLAGLFKPKNTPMQWNANLNWQPIPYDYQPLEKDDLLLVRTSCPRYHEEYLNVLELPEVKAVFDANQNLFQELTDFTGWNITNLNDVQSLYSTLRAESEYGLELPEWTKPYYPDGILDITEKSFIYNVYNDELKKLKGGPFLKKMTKEWTDYASGTPEVKDRKISIYTGHDQTVVNILSAINVWEQELPVYGIMAIFELYEDISTKSFGVKVYLRSCPNKPPILLTIPGCDSYCPLGEFLNLAKNVIPSGDMAKDCKAESESFTEPSVEGGP